jgi:peptide/nickel transport system substrate-binding protein
MKATRTGLAVLAAAALGLTACGGGGGSSSSSGGGGGGGNLVDGKTFTMAIATDPGSLDPLMTVLSVTRGMDRFLYGTLIDLAPNGDVVPFLAEKWQADTTKASFTLRKGITCSDGSPLTATQVADNINFVGDAKNKSPLVGIQVMPGTKATADDSANTVDVTSGAPDAFLLRNIGTLAIACGKGLTDRSQLAKGQDGTGMFAISDAVANDHYTMTRRKDFTWGPGNFDPKQKGLPDKVTFKVIQNESTSANLLLSGQLNAATILGPDQQRLLSQNLFHADLLSPLGELYFNQAAGHPGADPAVRKALVQALDLQQVGKVLTNGRGKPSQGFVTVSPKPCSGDNVSGNLPNHDVSAAKSALDSAGWKAGAGGVRSKDGKKLAITLMYGTQLGPTEASAAELIQQAWKPLGVDVTLKGVDSPGLNTLYFGTGAWDASMAPITLNLPSQLVPFVSGPVPPNGTNFAHIQNKDYESAVKTASTKAGSAGCDDWNSAEKALIKSVDAIPYYNTVAPTFGKGAKFTVGDGLDPSSIRMLG